MEKFCIFESEKICSDCGECYRCDLNSTKKCNNCGKCLELEGYDTKAIKIDEIATRGSETHPRTLASERAEKEFVPDFLDSDNDL